MVPIRPMKARETEQQLLRPQGRSVEEAGLRTPLNFKSHAISMSGCPRISISQFKPFSPPETLSFEVLRHRTKLETQPGSRGPRQVLEAKVDLGSVRLSA